MCRNGKREFDERGRKMCQGSSDGIRVGTKTHYVEKFRSVRKCKKGNTGKENLEAARARCKEEQAKIKKFMHDEQEDHDAKTLKSEEMSDLRSDPRVNKLSSPYGSKEARAILVVVAAWRGSAPPGRCELLLFCLFARGSLLPSQ